LSSDYLAQYDDLQFHSFSCIISFFFMAN
jgi:hypothetical protein